MTHTPEPTPEPEPDSDLMSDMERAEERAYYAGAGAGSLDAFAYDSQGNDTGLRESDFI